MSLFSPFFHRSWRSHLARVAHTALLAAATQHYTRAPDPITGAGDVLTIDGHNVTEECLNINFSHFLRQHKATPGEQQIREWMISFIERQVLIAEALREGYGTRPEVTDGLRQMEEHVLTDPTGPLYTLLYNSRQSHTDRPYIVPSQQLQLSFETAEVPKSALQANGTSFSPNTSASATTKGIERLISESNRINYQTESGSWPFGHSFSLATLLVASPVDKWEAFDAGDSWLIYRVRSHPRIQPQSVSRSLLLSKVSRFSIIKDIRHTRELLLMSCAHLTFDWPAAELIAGSLAHKRVDPGSNLDVKLLGLPGNLQLAELVRPLEVQIVTVQDLVSFYNAQFLRNLPSQPFEVYDLVRQLLMFRSDLQEARELALDLTPSFIAHRDNYRDQLLLGLYESEQLIPRLNIGHRDAGAYYNAHLHDFIFPTRVTGHVFTFDSFSTAAAFARSVSRGKGGEEERSHPSILFTVTATAIYDGVPPLSHLVLSANSPRVLGPLSNGEGWIVWIREHTLETDQISLESAEKRILYKLEQQQLRGAEMALAGLLERKLTIHNYIPITRLLSLAANQDPQL